MSYPGGSYAYQNEMLQNEILSASPHRLIQLLLENALQRIQIARQSMQRTVF